MRKRIAFLVLAPFLICTVASNPLFASDTSILGRWQGKAETPNGPYELTFEFKQEGGKLVGTATVMQTSGAFTSVKFENPSFSAELQIHGETYRMSAEMKEGKLAGTWEQIGGDVRGRWTAEPEAAQTPSALAQTGISGIWETFALTPNGDMTAALELKQEGSNVSGEFRSDMGSLPIRAASFNDGRLQFDIDFGGNTYRIKAELKEGKFAGGWAPADGGEGGAWSATRKAGMPATEAKTAPATVVGLWNAVANSPDGDLEVQMEIKQAGDSLTGQFITPDGSLPLPKLVFANDKLSFEVEYMGGLYRIELLLANDKLAGKWSAVSGSESGTFTAERKKS